MPSNPFSTFTNTITSTLGPGRGLEGGPPDIQVAGDHNANDANVDGDDHDANNDVADDNVDDHDYFA